MTQQVKQRIAATSNGMDARKLTTKEKIGVEGDTTDLPDAPNRRYSTSKYSNWQQPLLTMLAVFTIAVTILIVVNDFLYPRSDQLAFHFNTNAPAIGAWFAVYTFGMILARFIECGSYVLIEQVWCCNIGMILVVVGIATHRPALVATAMAGVALDQLCWYIDLIAYATIGKFPIGAAKYLVWPSTSVVKKLTCTHHLWFLPLCLYTLNGVIPSYTFILSCIFTSSASALSRLLTPLNIADSNDPTFTHYLNINAAYHFWKDVPIKFLHIADFQPWYIYLPYLFVVGNLLNTPAVLFIQLIGSTIVQPMMSK